MEEIKAILLQISDRLGMQDERLARIENLLQEIIRDNQPVIFAEEEISVSSESQESDDSKLELMRDDEF